MTFDLVDDGTLDTILECQTCKEQLRFSPMESDTEDGSAWRAEYNLFVLDCRLDARLEHVCDLRAHWRGRGRIHAVPYNRAPPDALCGAKGPWDNLDGTTNSIGCRRCRRRMGALGLDSDNPGGTQ